MPAKKTSFDPKQSQVNEDTLNEFLRSPLTGKLDKVPGVGEKCIELLAEDAHGSVTNAHQLFGMFSTLRPDEDDAAEHCERFYIWLEMKGVNSHRNTIVQAVAMKTDMVYPGVYDATKYT